jgi:hypothetical protein
MQTKVTIESVEIDGLKPLFAVGSFDYTDPQVVGDGDDIVLTEGTYFSPMKQMTGKLTLSLAGVVSNTILIKQLKNIAQYNKFTINARDGSGTLVQFVFNGVTRKTVLNNSIGIESSVTNDIEFSYGKDVVIS